MNLNLWLLRAWMVLKAEEGQDLIEYALLMVLIALFAVAAIGSVGKAIVTVFNNAATGLNAQPGP